MTLLWVTIVLLLSTMSFADQTQTPKQKHEAHGVAPHEDINAMSNEPNIVAANDSGNRDKSNVGLRGMKDEPSELLGETVESTMPRRKLPGADYGFFDGDFSATEAGAASGLIFLILLVLFLYCCCGCSLMDICMLWCCYEICCDNGVPFD